MVAHLSRTKVQLQIRVLFQHNADQAFLRKFIPALFTRTSKEFQLWRRTLTHC